ncbi:MAG: YraN family protein [Planctomycetales bacterium]|nr:YraN family protein [Planctomycetales bacterium]
MRWWRHWRRWLGRRRQPLTLGQRGEMAAARYLRRLGYKIIARGQRSRGGELDIIAVDGRTVVFVEVKTRTSDVAGQPLDAITADKQRRLTRAALTYMKRHDLLECSCRFDVVSVVWPERAKRPEIEHLKHAFEAVGRGQMFS